MGRRRPLGVFWAEKIYKKGAGAQNIAKKDAHWHQASGGKMVKGIIRPTSFSCPDGCTSLSSYHKQGAAKAAGGYGSRRARHDGEEDNVFKAAMQAVGLRVEAVSV